MISMSEIEKVVREKIEQDEKPGEYTGGSGHLGSVDFQIDYIGKPVLTADGYRVNYRYTRIVTTEFTYLPDNPPHRIPVEGFILIDPCNS